MSLFPALQGAIEEYDHLVQGHLFWNRYFGEGPDAPPRGHPSTCSSTMLRGRDAQGKPFALIIDPTLRKTPEDYYFDVNRRTGLRPDAVTHCFSTHHHADHINGLLYFPDAQWLAAAPAAAVMHTLAEPAFQRIQPVEGEFLPGLAAVPLPGHTMTLHGIAFSYRGKRYLVAGDGVMTKYHFRDETTEFEEDAAIAASTIRAIKESFDFVIPGHDGLIVV